jgi:HK97 family phage major capsid protein
MTKLKYLKLKDGHGLTEDDLKFVAMIDEGLDGAIEAKADNKALVELTEKVKAMKSEHEFDSLQKQLNQIFLQLDPLNQPMASPKGDEKKHRQLTEKWVRTFLRRDAMGLKAINKELKEGGWLPGDGGLPLLDNGPEVMHGAHGFDPEQGAVLVPELMLAEINRWVYEAGIARRDMRYLPFGGPGNERRLPLLLRSVVVGWVAQGGIKPKSKPYIDDVIQKLEKLAVIVPMTEEIVEDVAIDLVAEVGRLIGEAIAIEEDRVFLAGNVGIGDPFNGVLNAAGVVPVPLGGAPLTPELLDPMNLAIPTPAIAGGKFYMNRRTFSILRTLRADVLAAGDGLGQYLVQAPTETGAPYTMWGFPIVFSDEIPAFQDVAGAAPFMFFANLQKTCVYGDKQGIRTKILTEASLTDNVGGIINLAERDMIAIRVFKRVGYVPVLPDGIAVFTK